MSKRTFKVELLVESALEVELVKNSLAKLGVVNKISEIGNADGKLSDVQRDAYMSVWFALREWETFRSLSGAVEITVFVREQVEDRLKAVCVDALEQSAEEGLLVDLIDHASSPEDVRAWLASTTHLGLIMDGMIALQRLEGLLESDAAFGEWLLKHGSDSKGAFIEEGVKRTREFMFNLIQLLEEEIDLLGSEYTRSEAYQRFIRS